MKIMSFYKHKNGPLETSWLQIILLLNIKLMLKCIFPLFWTSDNDGWFQLMEVEFLHYYLLSFYFRCKCV